jgi:hypothetical protein
VSRSTRSRGSGIASSAASSASSTASFAAATVRYVDAVGVLLRRYGIALAVYAALLAGTIPLFRSVPTGFIPAQDQGYLITVIQLPDGASLERTDAVVRKASEIALGVEGVTYAVEFVGFSGATRANAANAAAIFVGLQPFEERDQHGRRAPTLIAELNQKFSAIQEGFVTVIAPPPVRGLGTAGGYKLYVQDRAAQGSAALQSATDALSRSRQRRSGAARPVHDVPRERAAALRRHRRTRAKTMDVPLGNVFEALQIYLGSVYVNDFNYLGRTFQVRAQADTGIPRRRAQRRALQDAQPRGRDGLARRRRRSEADDRARPRRPLQPLPGRRDQRRLATRNQFRHRARGRDAHRERDAPRRLRDRVDRPRLSGAIDREHRGVRVRALGAVRVPDARRAVRELGAAARHHPDRPDVSCSSRWSASRSADWTTTCSRRSA